jgi:hypothetical protein
MEAPAHCRDRGQHPGSLWNFNLVQDGVGLKDLLLAMKNFPAGVLDRQGQRRGNWRNLGLGQQRGDLQDQGGNPPESRLPVYA